MTTKNPAKNLSIQEHKPRTQYKYGIKPLLYGYSEAERMKIKARILERIAPTRSTTFSTWCNYKVGQKQIIPADYLRIIAEELGVAMETLFNF